MGLTLSVYPGEVTPFSRIPHKAALEITCMDNFEESHSFCESLNSGYLAQNNLQNRVRGSSFLVTGIIVAQSGVRERSYHRDKMNVGHWDRIVDFM